MFEKKTPQEAAGYNSGPPKQTYDCGPGLLMDYPREKLFVCCFFLGGFNKVSDNLGSCAFLIISNERNKESKRKKL